MGINPIPTGLFLCSKNQEGGGGGVGVEGHIVHPPLGETLLTFSESIQVKFFWKLVENESLDALLVSMETMVSVVIRWFIVFQFLTGNPYSKIKSLFPLCQVNKGYFSESL